VFLVVAGVYLAGAVAYGLMASGERQPWSRIEGEELMADEETRTIASDVTSRAEDSVNNGYGTADK